MKKELKIRVNSLEEYEQRLLDQKAVFDSVSKTRHVYFNTSDESVVKLVYEKNKPTVYTELEKIDSGFAFRKQESVIDDKTKYLELKKTCGISTEIIMGAKKYRFDSYIFGLYEVGSVGKFVILQGPDPSVSIVKDILGINAPEIVTQSFDKL